MPPFTPQPGGLLLLVHGDSPIPIAEEMGAEGCLMRGCWSWDRCHGGDGSSTTLLSPEVNLSLNGWEKER